MEKRKQLLTWWVPRLPLAIGLLKCRKRFRVCGGLAGESGPPMFQKWWDSLGSSPWRFTGLGAAAAIPRAELGREPKIEYRAIWLCANFGIVRGARLIDESLSSTLMFSRSSS